VERRACGIVTAPLRLSKTEDLRLKIEDKQKLEIEFWRDSELESPESDSLVAMINKFEEARVFLDCLERYHADLATEGKVLELGAGQGWASCLYKRLYPGAHVTVTDISKYALMSLHKWERLYDVAVDGSYACKSYETREEADSIDQIICHAAAHHFVAHERTISEIGRVLRPGGKAFYFYEPSAPRYLYRLARWRVIRKRPKVPEDVLIPSALRRMAGEHGLDFQMDYNLSLRKRGPWTTV
jgi:SAM-dependent methyltransferase